MSMRTPLATLTAILLLQACTGDKAADADSPNADSAAGRGGAAATDSAGGSATASVPIRNAAGRDLGTLTLSDTPSGIMAMGSLTGLPPGEHGAHIHMTGQCQAPFESAGGHWNPTTKQHGSQNPQGPHLGDMQNITVGADSSATVHLTTPAGTLRGANGLMDADGASIVIHAAADDYKTDPSGNSGARIACGVVTAS
jgi:Cu-Zn family superoxide dismutase